QGAAEDVRVSERGDLGHAGTARQSTDVDALRVERETRADVFVGEQGERQAAVEYALLVARLRRAHEDHPVPIEGRLPPFQMRRLAPRSDEDEQTVTVPGRHAS